jgi:hypothetical protein
VNDGLVELQIVAEWTVGIPLRGCRAIPIRLSGGPIDAVAVAYSSSLGCNPWIEIFAFPTDTLKLAVFDLSGRQIWVRDLGPGVLPDGNFCPLYAFDLNGDGADELFFVNNVDPVHPLAISKYRLERVDARDGRTMGQWPWPAYNADGPMNDAFRNAILGGHVHGRPVLVTAQGTYGDMYLQGWNADLSRRWEIAIPAGSRGARGSHMHPVVDLNGDGVDELMWGERCIELDGGGELFCADADTYDGHSDAIQPFIDPTSGRWLLYAAREKKTTVAPRVAVYDDRGRRVWGAVERGHMHVNWVAQLQPGRRTAMSTRIDSHVETPRGRMLINREVFAFDASTGEPLELPFDPHQTIPVDINGDGVHELVRGSAHEGGGGGELLDGTGRVLGSVGDRVALASKCLDLPGEHLLTWSAEGALRFWADARACDTDAATARCAHPFYALNQRSTACGQHLTMLGGV